MEERFKRPLILITNHFPFGYGEPFLKEEIDHLIRAFQVIILARNTAAESINDTSTPVSVYRISPQSSTHDKFITFFLFLRHFKRVIDYCIKEIRYLRQKNVKLSISVWRSLFHDLSKALNISYHLEKIIRQEKLTHKVGVYSYWLNSAALATTFVKRPGTSIIKFARAHRGDLYQDIHPLGYLSFREVLAENLDGLFPISENGANYIKRIVSTRFHDKITISRLGTKSAKQSSRTRHSKEFLVVSCSILKPVKRVDLIINALSLIHNLSIRWLHFGDGLMKAKLTQLAIEKLEGKGNIKYSFMGMLSNTDVFNFYENNYVHLFINTSASEGIPVSIMEAQSFGIPVIAPDAGGIPEIVSEKTGLLIPVNAHPEEIAQAIRQILTLPEAMYQKLRQDSIENWRMFFDAEKNFSTFIKQIEDLYNEAE